MGELTGWPWGVCLTLAALIGLCVGSFINVVIVRLPAWERYLLGLESQGLDPPATAATTRIAHTPPPNLLRPASHCPSCRHPLAASDNIPLLSYLLLRGHCRYCDAKINVRYPLIELGAALMTTGVLWRYGLAWEVVRIWVLGFFLIALGVIDWREQQLPDRLTQPMLWLGLLNTLTLADGGYATVSGLSHQLANSVWGAIIGYSSLWLLMRVFKLLTGRDGMGLGDVKLLAAIGAWLGVSALLPVLFLASLIGLSTALSLVALRRAGLADAFPFGTFLAIATFCLSVLRWQDYLPLLRGVH
jgi:leader peptidase (prepilin peptidase) / N-methyltransferase